MQFDQQSLSIKTGDVDVSGASRLEAPLLNIVPANSERASNLLAEWIESTSALGFEEFIIGLRNNELITSFLAAVFDLSPYIFALAKQYPEVIQGCIEEGFQATFDKVTCQVVDIKEDLTQSELSIIVRMVKKKAALLAGLADLGGWWTWDQVSRAISHVADSTLQVAVSFLLREAHFNGKIVLNDPGSPQIQCGYCVLAMGKHGARELNYSSDIDLVVFFDPDASAIIDRDESVALFVRLTKQLIKIMQERTADGYVFRTDLRLRPDPGSMPLAIPLPVALNYYESRGQNWERAAFIKARAVAGDLELAQNFLDQLKPFIWRRYLDFAAIEDVHSIKRQIQTHRGYSDLNVENHNLKLGRGGIREIEFFVQTQQLIAGGRNPALRGLRTQEVLKVLAKEDWIEESAAAELIQSYAFLRDVEHRLQMVADEQTHSIPGNVDDIQRISNLCAFPALEDFNKAVLFHLKRVEHHYAALFSSADALSSEVGNLSFTGDDDDPGTLEALARMGFQNPSRVIALVRGWHYGRFPVLQSERAREHLTKLTPSLLKSFAETKRGDETILEFDEFLGGMPPGMQLFSVLLANPKLLSLLTLVLSAAPRLAKIVIRRPHIFDGVLEPGFFNIHPDVGHWTTVLQQSMKQSRDYEDGLNRVRIFAAEQKFLIGIRLLSRTISAQDAGKLFSELAELLLLEMVRWVRDDFSKTHGFVPNSDFAMVGLGNLGSKELTAGSDLDLMLVYQFDPQFDESNGEKPLHASQYFGRFAQRLISAMSAPTAQGVVYEMDFRLRPYGSAGPIATSLRALRQYYQDSAWNWERLALTRARVLGNETAFSTSISSAIKSAIVPDTKVAQVAKDVAEMRFLMDEERQATGVWDLKLVKGGLIDIDFLLQTKELLKTKSEALGAENENDFLANDISALNKTRGDYDKVIHLLRLCLEKDDSVEDAPTGFRELLIAVLELPDMKSAEGHLKSLQRSVRKIFTTELKSLAASSRF